MHSQFRRIAANVLVLALAGSPLLSAGPDALRTVAHTSVALAQISLELCQMGLTVLRVCGI